MAKVLILTGDAAEDLEVMYPYQRLLEEGYEVHIAAPSKKKLQFVVHDFVEGFDTYIERPGRSWPADVAFADVTRPSTWRWCCPAAGRRSTCATTRTASGSCSTSSPPTSRSPNCATAR